MGFHDPKNLSRGFPRKHSNASRIRRSYSGRSRSRAHLAVSTKRVSFQTSEFAFTYDYVIRVALPYCPEQAPMGARSSRAKIWGWAVTRRKCLNGSTIPEQDPHRMRSWQPCMGPNRLASSVRPCFVEASPTVEKAVSRYKEDRLVDSLLSFRSVQSSPAVREFLAAREERCEPGH